MSDPSNHPLSPAFTDDSNPPNPDRDEQSASPPGLFEPSIEPVGVAPHENLQPATPTPGEPSASQELPKTSPSSLPEGGPTPRSGKLSSWQEHSITPIAGKAHLSRFRQQECREMDPISVEIPVDDFALYLVPGTDPTPQELDRFDEFNPAMFAVVDGNKTIDNPEKKMYAEVVRVTQSIFDNCSAQGLNRLVAKDTGDRGESSLPNKGDKKPDVIIYPDFPRASKDYDITDETRVKSVSSDERRPYLARTSWRWAIVPIEIKVDNSKAPYDFAATYTNFIRGSLASMESRGQILEYANAIMNHQHRQHVFLLVVCRSRARVLRVDHVGIVVSQPFDIFGKKSFFYVFFYRLARMTPQQQGFDPTARLADEADIGKMKDAVGSLSEYHAKCLKKAMNDDYPIYKITFNASQLADVKSNREDDTFLIGRPLNISYSLSGRATKTFAAYDVHADRVEFLKDAWKYASSRVHPEWEIYKVLNHAKVPYVATLLYGGYVDGQRTLSQKFLPGVRSPCARLHYRMVLKQLGRPLYEYQHSAQLIYLLWCVLLAHRGAYKAGILHRDLSPMNIVINEVDPRDRNMLMALNADEPEHGAGLLIDFDLGKFLDQLENGPAQFERSGTWQFMSALLLKYPKKQNSLSDDLESIVLMAEWMALKYHDHNLGPEELQSYISNFFDWRVRKQGHDVGGGEKLKQWTTGQRSWELTNRNSIFRSLLQKLLELAKEHYKAFDTSKLEPQETIQPPQYSLVEFVMSERSIAMLQDSEAGEDLQDAMLPGDSSATLSSDTGPVPTADAEASHSAAIHPMHTPPRLTLDTYDAMIAIFREVIRWMTKHPKDIEDDKVKDQFAAFKQSEESSLDEQGEIQKPRQKRSRLGDSDSTAV
ncbi:uncharacterized protein LAESUDRAFT_757773 [Laetiporus sulphureus 93-53]|uniref:Protein kinase domain-containing protein n=1 Tax=Laetiporus sulphureus 93-53 TaxID=1314785 RepID=A0A165EZW1_9APHY|nr:uncharacterized protein LAESUDRAFT_757773 [Laetiporus sulphureus 93-53]KZT08075.1 hypothetical protein LAESUDRAFT_757773 [Laetiporus sulphureus 93-53]